MAYEQPDFNRKRLVELFRYTRIINSPVTASTLPDFSIENKGDIRTLRMERPFSADELKTYIFRQFSEKNEFLILSSRKNVHYGTDYLFRVRDSSI